MSGKGRIDGWNEQGSIARGQGKGNKGHKGRPSQTLALGEEQRTKGQKGKPDSWMGGKGHAQAHDVRIPVPCTDASKNGEVLWAGAHAQSAA